MTPLRIIFFGTAELACASLEALAKAPPFEVVAVVTQPDRPRGRDLKLQPSPVKQTALNFGKPVLQPERARHPEFLKQLQELKPDLIVVAAYGQILPQALLDIPPHGCLNVHTSLLPKYRGAAPIQWAILDGEAVTGVTIMKMDAGLDTGGIVTQATTLIHPEDNSQSLHDRLAVMGAELLVKVIPEYVSGRVIPLPQPADGASYARKITKEDARLDWNLPAVTLLNRVRGLTPWPGTQTRLLTGPKATLLKVWRAEPVPDLSGEPGTTLAADRSGIIVACGIGSLKLLEVQREGGRRLAVADFLAGHPLKPGDKFEV